MYVPASAALIGAGDVAADAVMPQLENHFGSWRGSAGAARPVVPQAPQPGASQIHIVDMPGAEQSVIRMGWVGVARSTPEYFPLQVLNTVLGGSFTSRLNQNLREKNGYAYGASSGFDMRLSAGPFSARANVQTDKTSEALREFFNELDAITRPIPPDELEKARNFVALGFPSQFETVGDLSAQMEDLIVYELPDDYFEEYVANIRAVTPAAVQRVAGTYIQPDRFVIVVVGDRKVIEPGIRALSLAPIRVMTVEEAIGS
jgi:predicted Zn-dependent peptidase